jgi:hypothetical protein
MTNFDTIDRGRKIYEYLRRGACPAGLIAYVDAWL